MKLYIEKEQALVDAAFYVLLSARQAMLQKITVLLTQAKKPKKPRLASWSMQKVSDGGLFI